MKNLLTFLLLLTGLTAFSQYNPYTGSIDWTPNSGKNGIQGTFDCGQSITADFTLGISGLIDADPADGELEFTVGITGLEFDGAVAADLISGPFSEYFSYSFLDPNTIKAIQIDIIPVTGPDPLNPIQGNIEVDVKVPNDANTGDNIAINVNLQVPGYMQASNIQADDNESTTGDVECITGQISGSVSVTNLAGGMPDTMLNDVEISLYNIAGDLLDSTFTDENGYYLFDSLPEGDYLVIQTQPEEFSSVSDFDQSSDSDFTDLTDQFNGYPVNDTIPVELGMSGSTEEIDTDNNFVEQPNAPLPVSYLFISAEVVENDIHVKWATSLEINASHYEVQRSRDGSNFEPIGREEARGNSSETSNYKYVDSNIENGSYYYRLKNYDLDGKYDYSPIVKAIIDTDTYFNTYPNPTSGLLTIEYGKEMEVTSLEIFDSSGKLARVLDVNQKSHDISNLPNGTYIVRLVSNLGIKTHKIFKH